jgi:hypothetical protein
LGYSLGAAIGWHGRLNFTCCRVAVKWEMGTLRLQPEVRVQLDSHLPSRTQRGEGRKQSRLGA